MRSGRYALMGVAAQLYRNQEQQRRVADMREAMRIAAEEKAKAAIGPKKRRGRPPRDAK